MTVCIGCESEEQFADLEEKLEELVKLSLEYHEAVKEHHLFGQQQTDILSGT